MKKAPSLLPLQYCTVGRAARMLGVESEDIEHWLEVGFIQPVIKLPAAYKTQSLVVLTDEQLEALDSPMQIQSVKDSNLLNFCLEGFIFGDRDASNYRPPISENWRNEVKNFDNMITVSGVVWGIGQLSYIEMVDELIREGELESPIIYTPTDDESITISCSLCDEIITKDDMLISFDGLRKLHAGLYPASSSKVTPFSMDEQAVKRVDPPNSAEPVIAKQSDMIVNLIRSNHVLCESFTSAKTWVAKHKVLKDHIKKECGANINVTEKTLSNWLRGHSF
ncbi:hypothetical protein [Vibrio parahaemolyticus]|uniref:hypothetical protein n=1 Tax=Vibrio parahaemolyticus TaxID=670 RepID=UPI0023609840|nr:hypothetical protein [Vibrio parahaemolyticus]EJG0884010.1 hypothetical protein [Vibrio parahaemolyticus]MDL2013380.1 hypothetical protein [Vibrio parahaemolyticus]HCG6790329.1 hypothetical protein [Vibrio parahaemolyticus]HCH3852163.1 hypothetical protein [Vibrio parahaemolyticus]HCM1417201.1 hypothetical protein [Vibrio parahaemolyticus]